MMSLRLYGSKAGASVKRKANAEAVVAAAAEKKKKAAGRVGGGGRGGYDILGQQQSASDTMKRMQRMLFIPDESYLQNAQNLKDNEEELKRRFIIDQAVKVFRRDMQERRLEAEKRAIESQQQAMMLLKNLSQDLWQEAARLDYSFPPLHRRPMTKTLPARPLYTDPQFID
jgi:Mitochondrial ribosomal protein L28